MGLPVIVTLEGINLQCPFDHIEKALQEPAEDQDDSFMNNTNVQPRRRHEIDPHWLKSAPPFAARTLHMQHSGKLLAIGCACIGAKRNAGNVVSITRIASMEGEN